MKRLIKFGLGAAVAAIALASIAAGGARAAGTSAAAREKRQRFLRGAELWPIYCNTCHNARPGGEFSPAEWNMILMHMRTQANLTPRDAHAILEYLKDSR